MSTTSDLFESHMGNDSDHADIYLKLTNMS